METNQQQNVEVPLSEDAQEAKEIMQRELMRSMANKMMAAALEEERARRIEEMQNQGADDEDTVKKNACEQLIVVQEDLVRTLNLMKVKNEQEVERAQRITVDKKKCVHDELIRKSAVKEVDKQSEEERERRIEEGKEELTEEKKTTYNKLVTVQEDLLKTFHKMKAEGVKLEQERRVLAGRKEMFQEELVHSVGTKEADTLMDKEKSRRTDNLSDEEIQRRVAIAHKMLDVQKELLATQKLARPISGTISKQVLEEAKDYVQQQLLRKAAQKEAIAAMDMEQKRRINESDTGPRRVSDAQASILESINRQANIKMAKGMVDTTQQDYIQAEIKARVQEDTVRKVNQKKVDKAMDEERLARVSENSGMDQPHISEGIKMELETRSK